MQELQRFRMATNIVKECVVRDADEDTTDFADAQSANGQYSGYTIAKWDGI